MKNKEKLELEKLFDIRNEIRSRGEQLQLEKTSSNTPNYNASSEVLNYINGTLPVHLKTKDEEVEIVYTPEEPVDDYDLSNYLEKEDIN